VFGEARGLLKNNTKIFVKGMKSHAALITVQHCHQYYGNVNIVISDTFLLTSSCSLLKSVKGSMQQNSKFLYSRVDDVRDRCGPFSPEESSISYSSCNQNNQFAAEMQK
jgi:hypothetical protein